jgi:hypothetical protein
LRKIQVVALLCLFALIFDYWTGNGGLVKGSAVALLRGFMAISGGA